VENLSSSAELKTPGCFKALTTLVTIGILLAFIGSIVLRQGIRLPEGRYSRFEPILYGCLIAIGVLIVLAWILNKVIYRQLLKVKLSEPAARASTPVRPGETLRFEYEQKVNSATNIQDTEIELILREWVKYTSGTDTYTKSHEHVIERQVMPGGVVNPGNMIFQSVRLRMPEGAMHSFVAHDPGIQHMIEDPTMPNIYSKTAAQLDPVKQAELEQHVADMPPHIRRFLAAYTGTSAKDTAGSPYHNTLRWFVRVRVRMVMWPDYIQDFQITVMPEQGVGEEAPGFDLL